MSTFTHERLDVYRVALEFLVVADHQAGALPEGAGEFASADKAAFYRMARRSGTECAAILDSCRLLRLSGETDPDVE